MRKPIPKITALTTMLVALVVAAYALKEPAREIWYLHQLQSEDQTTRVEAAFILAEMGCLKAILPLFKEMPIGYFSRDFHDLALRKFATPEAVPEFAKALKDPDPRIRREAAEYLQAIDTEPARTTLASHLDDDDPSVRQWIVGGLGRAGVKGVPFLVRALTNSNDSTRLLALSSLKQLGPNARRAGDSIEECLLDASPDVYEEAKEVMVEIGMDLLPFCLSALASPDRKVRLRAAEILTEPAQATERAGAAIPVLRQLLLEEKEEEFDGSDYHPALESLFRASVQSAKVGLGDEDFRIRSLAASCLGDAATSRDQALSALVLALKDQDWRVRQAAAESLGYLEEDEAVLPLTAALADEAAGVRIAAAEALGRFGPKARDAAPSLLEALKSEDAIERKQAASTLGDIGGNVMGAVPPLRRLLQDPSPKVRIWAADALARLDADEESGLPFLLKALKEFEDDLRACTALAIGRIGRPARAAIPDLKRLLTDSSYFVRASAARALARMGVESLPVLLELIRPLNRTSPLELWHALNEMELEPTSVPMLIGFLKDGMESLPEDLNLRLRSWAASRLGKLSLEAKAAVPALVQALGDQNEDVASASRCALAAMGHVAVPMLLEYLNGEDHGLMQQAIEALGAIGPEARAAVPDLIQWLKLAPPRDVSWALARIGPEAALPLAKALDDPDERFRSWVAFTLGQIGPGASRAIPALTERLEDPSETVRLNAADALGKIRGEVAEISKELMTKESPPR